MTVCDSAHSVGFSRWGVSRLLKTLSKTGSLSPKQKGRLEWKPTTTPWTDKLLIKKNVIYQARTYEH